MLILGIETSCDETAAAILEEKDGHFAVLSNIVSSQIKLHRKWGGVVPNLAAREHLKNIIPVISESLEKAKTRAEELDLVAVTAGPGLIPALLIGNMAAKTLSWIWQKPLIGINHIEGHIYANFVNTKSLDKKFPLLCLVVSGGHTQLVLMKNHLQYEIIGQTLDDAAGEAFDKVARILDLGYPGGPEIAKHAEQKIRNGKLSTIRDMQRRVCDLSFPRPMIKSQDLNFSFSGLKTAVLYSVKKNPAYKSQIADYCREFQQAVIDVLVAKTLVAAKKYRPKTISLAGGVSANKELRKQLGIAIKDNLPLVNYQIPNIDYSLDNATMIAVAGYYRWKKTKNKKGLLDAWKNLEANPNLELK
jgi:N6-L-threonylcarbamoyladenine synthase